MKRAYSYVRFSEKRQAWGDSQRRQVRKTLDYCERQGLLLDESLELQDSGVSAFRGDNAAVGRLSAFVEAVKEGRVAKGSYLIVESLDRLSRDQTLKAVGLFSNILEKGITIVTLDPEREYTYAAVNANIALLIEAVVVLLRGHEESKIKSVRVKDEWRERLSNARKEKLTARCPSWLRLSEDRKKFLHIKHAVEIVRRIFRDAIEGAGVATITKRLNESPNPNISRRGGPWEPSYIRSILQGRAVLGEYQSYTGTGADKKAFGPPIPDYYPRIISDADWHKAQKAIASRRTQQGPRGECVANLFTGILYAPDGGRMHLHAKQEGRYARPGEGKRKGWRHSGRNTLVNANAVRGVGGAAYVSFPYQRFEDGVLTWLQGISAADILPTAKDDGDYEDELKRLAGKLEDLTHRIGVVKARVMEQPDIVAYLDVLGTMERDHRETAVTLERLKQETTGRSSETVGEVQSLVSLIRASEGDERERLRDRLKARLRLIVDRITVEVRKEKYKGSRGRYFTGRLAETVITYKSGVTTTILIATWTDRVFGSSAWHDWFTMGCK